MRGRDLLVSTAPAREREELSDQSGRRAAGRMRASGFGRAKKLARHTVGQRGIADGSGEKMRRVVFDIDGADGRVGTNILGRHGSFLRQWRAGIIDRQRTVTGTDHDAYIPGVRRRRGEHEADRQQAAHDER